MGGGFDFLGIRLDFSLLEFLNSISWQFPRICYNFVGLDEYKHLFFFEKYGVQ